MQTYRKSSGSGAARIVTAPPGETTKETRQHPKPPTKCGAVIRKKQAAAPPAYSLKVSSLRIQARINGQELVAVLDICFEAKMIPEASAIRCNQIAYSY